ncbi:hypothetical protein RHGRI_006436 [Rhododendron griersonianum]|uniref:Uncharacterized protein n=1 Tax=Rhododendron griersonianum TaxID=479676 RepID=A0AAV6KU62_9ERIC|nr:hypothetical protein RHGRI_006436 [Rhododendron griersonianum]
MTARKRATSEAASTTTAAAAAKPLTTDPPMAPSKAGQILKVSLIFFVPYLYLILSHYNIEPDLKRSILINAAVSSAGFFLTLALIPVASRYLLRRNLFGYDINKKGTPQGSVKVPESLGIAVGIVFLVLAILFQYFNFTADSIVSTPPYCFLNCERKFSAKQLLSFDDVIIYFHFPTVSVLPFSSTY